ncbi:MAG: hypothetical protein MHM6MM_009495, partial [Cercozoa sp. M6MM]
MATAVFSVCRMALSESKPTAAVPELIADFEVNLRFAHKETGFGSDELSTQLRLLAEAKELFIKASDVSSELTLVIQQCEEATNVYDAKLLSVGSTSGQTEDSAQWQQRWQDPSLVESYLAVLQNQVNA